MDKNLIHARMLFYSFFSDVLNFLEKDETFSHVQQKLQLLSQNPLNDEMKEAFENMQGFLSKGYEALQNEQNDVFYSPVTSFIPFSASFYDEQRDDGRKKIQMIDYLKEAGFVKDESYKDSEDNIGFIFSFFSTLLQKADMDSINLSKKVFENIINPFIDEFIQKIYEHECGDFYKNMAIIMDIFIKFERLNFNIK